MIYDYECKDCSHVFEVWAKVSDPAPSECPKCGKPNVEKKIGPTSFALKGTGWYVTDYKNKSENKPASS